MMYKILNRSIYKKLCTIMIALGLVFSGGKLVYAHDQELKDAERAAIVNPTMKNLVYLYHLYVEDVEYHNSKGENAEAEKSSIHMQKIKNMIIEKKQTAHMKAPNTEETIKYATQIAKEDDKKHNWEWVAKRWAEVVKLYETVNFSRNETHAIKKAARARSMAASAEKRYVNKLINDISPLLCNAARKLFDDPTPENYSKYTKYRDRIVILSEAVIDVHDATCIKAKPLLLMADVAIHAAHRKKTVENYEKCAKYCYEVVEYFTPLIHNDSDYIEGQHTVDYYRNQAARAKAEQAKMIAKADGTAENYEKLAQCWEIVADSYEKLSNWYGQNSTFVYLQQTEQARLRAVKARAQQVKILKQGNKSTEYYGKLSQCWEDDANSYEKIANSYEKFDAVYSIEKIKQARVNATQARTKSEKASKKQAEMAELDRLFRPMVSYVVSEIISSESK